MSAEIPMIYIVPAAGRLLRRPDQSFSIIPEEGAWVPDVALNQLYLIHGDAIQLPEAPK